MAHFGRKEFNARWMFLLLTLLIVSAECLFARTASADSDNLKYLNHVYRDVILRPALPDEIALPARRLDKGVARQVVLEVIQRLEVHRKQQVRRIFARTLGRQPDTNETQQYTAELLAGKTVEHVAAEIFALDEFYFNVGGGTDGGFVDGVFVYATGDLPNPIYRDFYAGLLRQNSRLRVARQILNTEQAYDYLVRSWFHYFLHREATDAEAAAYVSMLLSHMREEAVFSEMMALDEYYRYAVERG